MIDSSKKATSFLCQKVVKKRSEKNCLQEGVVRKTENVCRSVFEKKSFQRKYYHLRPSLKRDEFCAKFYFSNVKGGDS